MAVKLSRKCGCKRKTRNKQTKRGKTMKGGARGPRPVLHSGRSMSWRSSSVKRGPNGTTYVAGLSTPVQGNLLKRLNPNSFITRTGVVNYPPKSPVINTTGYN